MAISFIGSTTDTEGANNNDLVLTIPGTYAADDYAVCVCGTAGTSGNTEDFTTATSGWSRERQDGSGAGTARTTAIFTKKLTSASETALTVSVTTLSLNHQAIMMVFRGVDTTTPLDVTTTYDGTQTNTLAADHVDITPVTDNGCLVITHCMTHGGDRSSDGVPATPTGITLGPVTTVNNRAEFSSGYKLDYGTAGAISIGTWTHGGSSANNDNSLYSIALRPQSAATGVGKLVNGGLVKTG